MQSARRPQPPPRDRDADLVRLVPLVAGWCARLGGGEIDAEAAAGDVFEVLLRRHADFDPARPLEGWAWGITVKVVHHHRRQSWWRRWLPGPTPERPAPGAPAAAAEARELQALVHGVLGALSDPYREVLVLCDLEERPAPEVAAILGVPEGTVRSRCRLARAAFRAEAARRGVDLTGLAEDPDDA